MLINNRLTKEEITEPGQPNCFRELERLGVESIMSEDRKGRNRREELIELEKKIAERIGDVKKVKSKLVAELTEKITTGSDLVSSLTDKSPAKQVKIAEFAAEFSAFLTVLKEARSYETEFTKTVAVGEEE